jgi:hypothetical protein
MSLVNLPVPTPEYNPGLLLSNDVYRHALNPTEAFLLGRDVLSLYSELPDAFFNRPITEETASQPIVHQHIKQAWLKLTNPKPGETLLDPNLKQTQRLLEHVRTIEKNFFTETLDASVLLISPRGVLLPSEVFQSSDEDTKLILPPNQKLQPTTVYTELTGIGDTVLHDRDSGIATKRSKVTGGDITVVKKGHPFSTMNMCLTDLRIVLVQTLPIY